MSGHSHHVELSPLPELPDSHGQEEGLSSAFAKIGVVGLVLLFVAVAATGVFGFPKAPEITVVHSVTGEEEPAEHHATPHGKKGPVSLHAAPRESSEVVAARVKRKLQFQQAFLKKAETPGAPGFPVAPQGEASTDPHLSGAHPSIEAPERSAAEAAKIFAKLEAQKEVSASELLNALNSAVISFKPGSSDLDSQSLELLKQAAKFIKKGPKDVRLEISGHTDATGDLTKNIGLSLKRATTVRNTLLGLGCRAGMFSATGLGDTKPIADNGTAEGRAKNRRMEFRLL